MSGDLSGRIALITGGSAGIGRATALRLATSGARVVIAGRAARNAAPLLDKLAAAGSPASFCALDVLDPDSVSRAVELTARKFGTIDVLVASGAGGTVPSKAFSETQPGDFVTYYAANLLSRLYPLAAVLPYMQRAGYGKAVLITSDAGRIPSPGQSLNGSAAAGLMFAVRALAQEYAREGIRINAVSLSLTRDTPSYARFVKGELSALQTASFAKIEARAAFGLNTPADVAEAVAFLVSSGADQISGATISVNGGLSFPG